MVLLDYAFVNDRSPLVVNHEKDAGIDGNVLKNQGVIENLDKSVIVHVSKSS